MLLERIAMSYRGLDYARAARRTLGWSAVYLVTAWFGRQTVVDGSALSLVWPAAGVAALWFIHGDLAWRPIDLLSLSACTYLVNHITGAPVALIWVFIAANAVQVLLFVEQCRALPANSHQRRQDREPQGIAGARQASNPDGAVCRFITEEPLRDVAQLWRLARYAVVATAAGAAVGSLGMSVALRAVTIEDYLVWWARNLAGLITVVAAAGIVARYTTKTSTEPTPRLRDDLHRLLVDRGLELAGLIMFTAFIYWAAFIRYPDLPVAFPIMLGTMWVGTRFGAGTAMTHSIGVVAVVVTLTLNHIGPFADLAQVQVEALVIQLVMLLTCIFALALALGHEERTRVHTALATATSAAEHDRARFEALANAVDSGVVLMTADGQVLVSNTAGDTLMGYGPQGPRRIPSGMFEILDLDGNPIPDSENLISRAINEHRTITGDYIARPIDSGPDRVLRSTVTPTIGADNQVDQVMIVYTDRTDDHRRILRLESFAGSVAHDLRSPLTALNGWVELAATLTERSLRSPGAGDASHRHDSAHPPAEEPPHHPGSHGHDCTRLSDLNHLLQRADEAGQRMSTLITDVLEFSQATTQPELTPTDLNQIAAEVSEQRRVAAPEGTVIDIGHLPPGMGQPTLLRQVLDNLVGNAITHARPGIAPQITITGRRNDDWTTITVTDNGVGIPEGQEAAVFRPFHRLNTRTDGHGLGLAISRRIIRSHGGQISITSRGTTGASVTFTIPATPHTTTSLRSVG